MAREEAGDEGGGFGGAFRVEVVPGALDDLQGAGARGQGGHDRRALGRGVGEVRVRRAHDDEHRDGDVGEFRLGVRPVGLHGEEELPHALGLGELGTQRGGVLGPVRRLGRIGGVQVPEPHAEAAEGDGGAHEQSAAPVAAYAQHGAEVRLGHAGEGVEFHDRADEFGGPRGGDGGRAAGEGLADEDGGPAEVPDKCQQVGGDVGAGDRRPAGAGVAVPAQVRGHDPVAGRGEEGREEAVRLTQVADAVREHDQRPVARRLVGDAAVVDAHVGRGSGAEGARVGQGRSVHGFRPGR
ncbi:putative hydrolase [Streptomyces sp. Tu6071]|nr:putative hydrolase [Streptomyces sp. Tu6071]